MHNRHHDKQAGQVRSSAKRKHPPQARLRALPSRRASTAVFEPALKVCCSCQLRYRTGPARRCSRCQLAALSARAAVQRTTRARFGGLKGRQPAAAASGGVFASSHRIATDRSRRKSRRRMRAACGPPPCAHELGAGPVGGRWHCRVHLFQLERYLNWESSLQMSLKFGRRRCRCNSGQLWASGWWPVLSNLAPPHQRGAATGQSI